uniref:Uncharacterized protein n=1 Tax=Romanomermis culicivorax TaxID=13658 RepID=A0A915HPE6_ROMCU
MENVPLVRNILEHYLRSIRLQLNQSCNDKEPWQIIAYTFASTCLAGLIYHIIYENRIPALLSKEFVFRRIRKLPWMKRKIENQLLEARRVFENDIHKCDPDKIFHTTLPESGYGEDEIVSMATEYSTM